MGRVVQIDPAQTPEARAITAGRSAYGPQWRPRRLASAPGRIELIGNHLDYNGGPVLAAAIDREVAVLAAAGNEALRVLASDVADAAPQLLDPRTLVQWRNQRKPESLDYARGAVAALLGRPDVGLRESLDLVVTGDVPIGFGLSSSAALCVALVLALAETRPDARELVLLAQEAEHRAGTPAGAMDQSASVAGGMIRFDGATLAVEQMDPELGDLVFAVADSGVERSLGSSAYSTRVEESARARQQISTLLSLELPHLAALTQDQFKRIEDMRPGLPDTLLRRARHVVTETARVVEAIEAVNQRDWLRFGQLMNASGRSSATDYEISHPRVEELVAESLAVDGVLGARMMGGGEGGTALILVRRDIVDTLEKTLRAGYYQRHGMAGRRDLIHVCTFAAGATVRDLDAHGAAE